MDQHTRLDVILGKRIAGSLEKNLGLLTIADLLENFPRRYLQRGEFSEISSLPFDEDVTILARVISSSTRTMRARRGTITDVVISDSDEGGPVLSSVKISFFNGFNARQKLQPGVLALFSGRVGSYGGHLTLTNPDFILLDEAVTTAADAAAMAKLPIPVYSATAKLTSWTVQRAVAMVLDQADTDHWFDPIPEWLRTRERLPGLSQAYRMIHQPTSVEQCYWARKRFRYQEALVLQTALARRRAETAQEVATSRPGVLDGALTAFDAQLPFTLTAGQRRVGEELSRELATSHPMNRLLQGDVGSGKTLVALRAMLQVIDSGGQAALLAPTEVLAAQHAESIRRTLGTLTRDGLLGPGDGPSVSVTLLTGSLPTAARRQALLDAASGDADIVVGTHALLSDNVTFFDLGLVVVDEQHRFGVEQRDVLRSKADAPPHLLVMTATPIPRTVAMTVFGDLETSVLDELPDGRSPITTHVVGLVENPRWEARLWQRAREEADAGRQVYIVCPKIGEGDSLADDDGGEALALFGAPAGGDGGAQELTGVVGMLEALRAEAALQGVRVEALHGRMPPEDKSRTMAAFAAGEVDVLVSTTVIEVGVDVPNATLMVILDADRFGISQLHQLRGRVGRGRLPGTCLLVTRLEPDHPSRERLAAVAATTDGFELSQEDLKLRREGDILGARQSGGRSTLKLLRVIQDEDVIALAREDAQELVAEDPGLEGHPALRMAIENYLNPEKEAFLERG
ncbi:MULTISPECIES: ATP-dependent DNA helicase RecG [Arthrobacter]|uniref:Probable DNA 3'-5' helicase RecG n=2 Tax=Arthrobacter TaxID=1663 RepID=A0ABU9KFG0_9MICC|nr:ATP-dependent DNA helicase RecG [Arthrobacter sp. YJM1]MDP5225548.1 ATP-dependent DNA helicase RecG [Arthrobacter sp. YJM1]